MVIKINSKHRRILKIYKSFVRLKLIKIIKIEDHMSEGQMSDDRMYKTAFCQWLETYFLNIF